MPYCDDPACLNSGLDLPFDAFERTKAGNPRGQCKECRNRKHREYFRKEYYPNNREEVTDRVIGNHRRKLGQTTPDKRVGPRSKNGGDRPGVGAKTIVDDGTTVGILIGQKQLTWIDQQAKATGKNRSAIIRAAIATVMELGLALCIDSNERKADNKTDKT